MIHETQSVLFHISLRRCKRKVISDFNYTDAKNVNWNDGISYLKRLNLS
jgi:hypothetical protein